MEGEIVPYETRDESAAQALSARAFSTEPGYEYLFPDEKVRTRAVREIKKAFLRVISKHKCSVLLKDGDILKGVMLITPANKKNSFLDWIWYGEVFRRLPFILGFSSLMRTLFTLDRMEAMEHLFCKGDDASGKGHYKLDLLAVEPEYQGKGFGGKLLRYLMPIIDKSNNTCYLETTKKSNVQIYKKFGFVVVFKEKMGGDGPYLKYMKRPRKDQSKEEMLAETEKLKKQITPITPSDVKKWICMQTMILLVGVIVLAFGLKLLIFGF